MLESEKRTDSPNTVEKPKISTKETTNRIKEIKCYYTNACSLRNKMNELAHIVDENSIDVIGITETWARQEHNDAEFDIEGFQLYRKDNKSGYGGVMMYVNNKMRATLCEELTSDEFEDSVWCRIDAGDNHGLLIGTVYRSPNSTEDNNDKLLKLMKEATEYDSRMRMVIMGDFNLPEIDYENYMVRGDNESYQARFFEITQDMFLVQNVFEVTRIRQGQQPSKLDYIFTKEEDEIVQLEYMCPLGLSDHVGLKWKYNITLGTMQTQRRDRLAYWKCDFGAMTAYLDEINWEEKLNSKDVEESWKIIRNIYEDSVQRFTPVIKHRNKKKLPFMKKETKKLINKRERLFRVYSRTRRELDFEKYKKIRNEVTAAIRRDKLQDISKKCELFKSNKKAFYGYVKSKQSSRQSVIQLKTVDGQLTNDQKEAAEELSTYFKSVYVKEDTSHIPHFHPVNMSKPETTMEKLIITEEEVLKCLTKLNGNKSPGPDEMHPMIFKRTATSWVYPLKKLFQRSVDAGTLPIDWKTANITPIFKKGSKTDAGNYRPVSLTSVPCKILETIIRRHIVEHVERSGLFSRHQHGFMKNRSCLTNLLETVEDWTRALEEGFGMDVLYLDYQKAFDTVPHCRLIKKLKWYGIDESLSKWIMNFVSQRQMRVRVGEESSSWSSIDSGVPQGSVLGPLLFVLYVNEISCLVKSKIKMFADDTKLWRKIKSEEDKIILQADMDKLNKWSEDWLLKFNVDKCKRMTIGKVPDGDYQIGTGVNRKTIQTVVEEKDLGICITNDLKWSGQCSAAASKAMKALGLIKRTFGYLNKELFLNLYSTYVRPHLEFCVQVWAPYYRKDIDKLENVQRRATKLVNCIRKQKYEERLRYLGLFSLERRRRRGDLIEAYKIIKNIDDIESSQFFETSNTRNLRGHQYKMYKSYVNKTCRKNFFSHRVINDWNRLPNEVVDASTLATFKNRLDQYMNREDLGNKSC